MKNSRQHDQVKNLHRPAGRPVQRKPRLSAANSPLKALGNQGMGRLLGQRAQPTETSLPASLRAGVERLSGMTMSDVRVHYNSLRPASVDALAATQGNEIHLGPRAEKHLPHEAWHVVQQRQHRVKPNLQLNNMAISEDALLEREADQMGAKAAAGESLGRAPQAFSFGPMLGHPVAQRKKKIPPGRAGKDDFGQFETTKFVKLDSGVDIELMFHPNPAKADAKKIALTQSVKTTLPSGAAYAIDPNSAKRMVPDGKSGAGFYIDQLSNVDSPLYADDVSLGAGKDLKDTPQTKQIGYCYKQNPADAEKKTESAMLTDSPQSAKKKGRSKTFETAALAVDGKDAGTYYGSVSWGYKIEGTDAAPTVTEMDIEPASKGTPTANFIEAAKLWNVAKTRGALRVTADPAKVVNSGKIEDLAKGTKLKQVKTVAWGDDPAINAEIPKADGSGSGKIVMIKSSDVEDIGDGAANKKLPIP